MTAGNGSHDDLGLAYRIAKLEDANRTRRGEYAELLAEIRELQRMGKVTNGALGGVALDLAEMKVNVALMLEWFQEFKRRKNRKARATR